MAFPDGLPGPAGTGWNVGPCCVAGVDDVAFARALVAQIQTIACIDPARVYAVGVLTGGGMAHYVACHAADVFAAVAPAAFDLLEENVNDCNPPRPITVISFRGTADSRVPYAGGPSSLVPGMPLTFLGAQATFEAWARIDRCVGAASPPDADGCSSYAGCQGGVEVILCTKEGGREEPGDASIAWPVLEAAHALIAFASVSNVAGSPHARLPRAPFRRVGRPAVTHSRMGATCRRPSRGVSHLC